MVELEVDKLSSKGSQKYLQEVKDEYFKDVEVKNLPVVVSQKMYLEQEKEKSDLYIFIKIFCPTLYQKYVRIETKEESENTTDLDRSQMASQALNTLKQANIGRVDVKIKK